MRELSLGYSSHYKTLRCVLWCILRMWCLCCCSPVGHVVAPRGGRGEGRRDPDLPPAAGHRAPRIVGRHHPHGAARRVSLRPEGGEAQQSSCARYPHTPIYTRGIKFYTYRTDFFFLIEEKVSVSKVISV